MEPQMQQQDMTPEESLSSLGLATRLSEQMLTQQAMQNGIMPQTPTQDAQNAPQQENGQDVGVSDDMDLEAQDGANKEPDKVDKSEEKMDSKMEILRTELKDTIKVEIDSIKQLIKDALNEENGEN